MLRPKLAGEIWLDANDVEPDPDVPRAFFPQPGGGARSDPGLLPCVDRFFRAAVAPSLAGLHLDKCEHATASHDEVDLDAARADVAGNDPISCAFEMFRGKSFALATEGLAFPLHGSSRGTGG